MVEALIGVPLSLGFALLGRWVQLHPEKLVMDGMFQGPHTLGARVFRTEVAFIGSLAVLGGTCGTISLLTLPFNSEALSAIGRIVGLIVGVTAALHVRKEVRRRRRDYVSSSPHGWWP